MNDRPNTKHSHSLGSLNSNHVEETTNELISKYQSSSTPNDLYNLIDQIDSTMSNIDNNLNNYTTLNSKKLQQDITNIELMRTSKLSTTISNTNKLTNIFSGANDLGHKLTFKIKSLDEEIGNVNKTLEYVNNIQLLKNNINQANYAIEHKNWELAARCIHTINSKIPSELISGKFASVVIPSTDIPELPTVAISNWIDKLTIVFKEQFNQAAKAKNVEQLTKFFQLFPLINQEEVGLNCYSKFICDIINETSKTLMTGLESAHDLKPGIFSSIVLQLFESISMMLSQHGPLIKKYYSDTYPSALSYVINKIQREIDLQVGIIADTFYDLRRLDKYFQDIQLYTFPVLSKRLAELKEHAVQEQDSYRNSFDTSDDLLPIRSIGDLIQELSSIFENWTLYCKFITIKYLHDPVTKDDVLMLPELIRKSTFTRKINEKLLPAFEKLYKFYFRRSLEKAITIEELPSLEQYLLLSNEKSISPDQVPASSVIEDLTLVLNSSLRSVVQSGIPSSVKSFINESFTIIQQDLINGFFIKNLNDNQPRYNQILSLVNPNESINRASTPISRTGTPDPLSATGATGFLKGASSALGSVVSGSSVIVGGLQTAPNNPKLLNFVIYLNTVAMAQEYFVKIFENIKKDHYLRSYYPFGKDSEKIDNILQHDFLDPFASISNKIISESLINLYNQSIKNRLLVLVNDFFSEVQTNNNESNYVIYTASNINDPSVLVKFTSNWQSLTKPYYQTLHKTIWNKVLRLIVVNLTNLLEKKLLFILNRLKINELGSIKLEKDVSYLINEICQDNYYLREKFVRLTQIVLLVGMDDEEYEDSNQPVTKIPKIKEQKVNEKDSKEEGQEDQQQQDEEEEEEEEDTGGINWVLTPQERNQIRQYRI
ncbi:Golgi transport complex subunit, putative [Candida maltosa Xu316]|uniref:Conserved oligomeric Golgi complex subunit 4 n=1 Tax=Candida maltosa (strain Xu316) TaxID=1245528 RepID=M3K748_CANMX|nr:Golgi transport complex subunit, putative [Candida maltosa Xu316]